MPSLVLLLVMSCAVLLPGPSDWDLRDRARAEGERIPFRTMPAEFERQSALVLAWDGSDPVACEVQLQIAKVAHVTVPVVVLVRHQADQQDAIDSLGMAGVDFGRIRLLRVPIDSPWIRDYGPSIVRDADIRPIAIDARYDIGRPNDDEIPVAIAQRIGCQTEQTGLVVEGGNLLSNGEGLGIATSRLREKCTEAGYSQEEIRSRLHSVYGFRQSVFLEPLEGECTGHVDMFATFTAPNVVVVGEYSPHTAPINAAILDRNATALNGLSTPFGPLRVVRIPMPPSDGDTFPSWTNVIYANGTLLVPNYPDVDRDLALKALAVYKKLLPSWKIKLIDCNRIIASGGALHCLSLNLPGLFRLPDNDPLNLIDSGPLPVFPEALLFSPRR